MARVQRTLKIPGSIGEVFAYMTLPENMVKWVTFLTHVHVTSTQTVGPDTCITCTLEILGKTISFDAVTTEYKENERLVFQTQEHAPFFLKNTLTFSTEGPYTKVEWVMDYSMGWAGKIGELGLLNYFNHELDRSLERVRQEFASRQVEKRLI